jgi:2-keto-4-pentenoate hydratase
MHLHLVKICVVSEGDLIELDPAMSYVLPLFLLESSLALIFALEEDGGLTSLSPIRVLAYLDRVMMGVEILEEGNDVLISAREWKSAHPQGRIVIHFN